jgi:hypothetical protein
MSGERGGVTLEDFHTGLPLYSSLVSRHVQLAT